MGVQRERFIEALYDIEDALERAGDALEWVVVDAQTEDLAAHALLGIKALTARLRDVTGQ